MLKGFQNIMLKSKKSFLIILWNFRKEYCEMFLPVVISGRIIGLFRMQEKYKVNHLHFHVQPRELYDEFYEKCHVLKIDVFKELSEEEMN